MASIRVRLKKKRKDSMISFLRHLLMKSLWPWISVYVIISMETIRECSCKCISIS